MTLKKGDTFLTTISTFHPSFGFRIKLVVWIASITCFEPPRGASAQIDVMVTCFPVMVLERAHTLAQADQVGAKQG